MKYWLNMSIFTALFWAVSFFVMPYTVAGGVVTEEGVKKSLAMNENLLTNSSLVRNIKKVNLPQVSEALEKALTFHKMAVKKVAAGDLSASVEARDESLRLLMLASRLAHQASGFVEKKAKKDYEKRIKNIQGLLAAHKRITDDNSAFDKERQLQKEVSLLITSAQESEAKQKYKEAISSLDKAYLIVANSIKSQRTGQTLVRSLDFATEEEAYEYELGRYENYQRLVDMMIDERRAFKRDERTRAFFDEANRYQVKAEDLVQEGQYKEAAKLIEKASKTLVNLLRDSGIHIPGA